MTYDAREKSTFGGAPYECYWFACGSQEWRYTSGDEPRTISIWSYAPEVITRSEIQQNQEMRSGEIKITLPLDNPVALLFRGFLPPRPVSVVIYRGHDGDPETVCSFTGIVSSCVFGEDAQLTVVPEQNAIKRTVPALTYQSQCPRALFSTGCGVGRETFRVLGLVSSVSGMQVHAAAFATKSDGYFNGGWLEFGYELRAIASHVGDQVTLMDPIDSLPIGAQVFAYPGCQGTEADCAGRFGNLVNHLGFGRIPSRNPFGTGGIA